MNLKGEYGWLQVFLHEKLSVPSEFLHKTVGNTFAVFTAADATDSSWGIGAPTCLITCLN
jgi:hypothetical protein